MSPYFVSVLNFCKVKIFIRLVVRIVQFILIFNSDLALVVLTGLGAGGGSTSDSAPDSELVSFSPFFLLFFFLLLCFLCFLFFLCGGSLSSLALMSSFSVASSSPAQGSRFFRLQKKTLGSSTTCPKPEVNHFLRCWIHSSSISYTFLCFLRTMWRVGANPTFNLLCALFPELLRKQK